MIKVYIYNPNITDNEIDNFVAKKYNYGPEIWTLNTYLNLKNIIPYLALCNKLPEEGVVLSHNDYLDKHFPSEKQYFVSLQADRGVSKNAHAVIVQNKDQMWERLLFDKCFFVRHWPEKNIVKRDASRVGLNSIKYLGNITNLDPYFLTKDWLNFCELNKIKWELVEERSKWSDFSEVDLLIAIRSFGKKKIKHKPATKLYNARIAGVPIIVGGNETAYYQEKVDENDFLSVASINGLKNEIINLKNDLKYYNSFRKTVFEFDGEFLVSNIAENWVTIIETILKRALKFNSTKRNLNYKIKKYLRNKI